MWKCHVVDANNNSICSIYTPLEGYINKDNHVSFNPVMNKKYATDECYGGTLMEALIPLISGDISSTNKETIQSNINNIEGFNANSLYYIYDSSSSGLLKTFGSGTQAESFTLHFE